MYVSWVLGDKLRIVMSSIMRWRRGEIGLVIGRLLSVGRHERAILADRTPPTDDTTPIGTADGPNLRTKVSLKATKTNHSRFEPLTSPQATTAAGHVAELVG